MTIYTVYFTPSFGGAVPDFTTLDGTEQFFVDYEFVSCP